MSMVGFDAGALMAGSVMAGPVLSGSNSRYPMLLGPARTDPAAWTPLLEARYKRAVFRL